MIRLVSLNIERSKHLDRIKPFLQSQKPDVLCLQELFERDIPFFEEQIGPCVAFGIVGLHPTDPPEHGSLMEGIGIFSALPVEARSVRYYLGSEENARTREPHVFNLDRSIVSCTFKKGDERFTIATTHFTWTRDGSVNDQQRTDLAHMLSVLDEQEEFVLCGDFNAPRGGEIFSALASKYKDNIPAHYTTSIDKDLHRAGDLQLMVDGLFTTPEYVASDVELHAGVSDHMAITANIEKNAEQ